MSHKYSAGQNVYYEPQFGNDVARGVYKIVRQLADRTRRASVLSDQEHCQSFERIAEEHQLIRSD